MRSLDRYLAIVTAAMVLVIISTANVHLSLWTLGRGAADLIAIVYLAALVALIVHPGSVTAHAFAAAGAAVFWGGRMVALTVEHFDGPRDLRTAIAVHAVACAALMGHHYRANRRIGLYRSLADIERDTT